ncbi:MAG: hypothetical protein LBI69_02435 [Puniceicoccales bacterium]|jgi:ABC-type transporter Mla subunit MlaD|nr:hypothetical protein [Puniceicoccales bacterium]
MKDVGPLDLNECYSQIDKKFQMDYGVIDIVKDKNDGKHSVGSLTDYLLNHIFSSESFDPLSPPDAANQSINLMDYRLNNMANAALCYAPIIQKEEQYTIPEIDVNRLGSIGAALAMLILSAMQNEIMLDTQLEAVKGTQNQKVSASNTTILKIRQQIRKARYKSGFQKFMEWMSDTWLMKFLNSNYGKVIMFIVGAAITIASFGTAGPAVIAISCILLSFQAAELILGKSMGELITQSMDDGSAKMAIQMSIDIGLMVADMLTGSAGGGAASAVENVDMAEDAAKFVQNSQEFVKQATEAIDQLENVLDSMKDAGKVLENTEEATAYLSKLKETLGEVTEASQELAKALDSGAGDVFEKAQKLQKSMLKLAEQSKEFSTKMGDLGKILAGSSEDVMKAFENLENLDFSKFLNENVEFFEKAFGKYGDVTKVIDSAKKDMDLISDQTKKASEELEKLSENLEKVSESFDLGDITKFKDTAKEIEGTLANIETTTKELKDGIEKGTLTAKEIQEKTEKLQDLTGQLTEQMGELTKQVEDIKDVLERSQGGRRFLENFKNFQETTGNLQETIENSKTNGKILENMLNNLDSGATVGTLRGDSDKFLTKVGKGIRSGARFLLGIRGLEYLNFAQQLTIALEKFQQRIRAFMELYQALYNLAKSEEEQRNIIYAAKVDAIRTESDAKQEFYQMLIDNQMSDIQALMSYVKASYERAAEAIMTQGETNRMIAQNLVI